MSGGRPPGPKRIAALEQVAALRAQKVPDSEIFTRLIESGLTKAQARELIPTPPVVDNTPVRVLDDDVRAANINGAVHFLETIAKRLTPNVCDRFTELVSVKSDALTWARKLKGVL